MVKSKTMVKPCNLLLKIFNKTYLMMPNIPKHKGVHIPTLDFAKQSSRNLLAKKNEQLKSESMIIQDSSRDLSTKKLQGAIMMNKQTGRKQSPIPHCVQNYYPKFTQVYPKVFTNVNYEKEISSMQNINKGRMPLMLPMTVERKPRNKSVLF